MKSGKDSGADFQGQGHSGMRTFYKLCQGNIYFHGYEYIFISELVLVTRVIENNKG